MMCSLICVLMLNDKLSRQRVVRQQLKNPNVQIMAPEVRKVCNN